MDYQKTKNEKTNGPKWGGGGKKLKSKPLYQTEPEVYGKVKWMATSKCVNLFLIVIKSKTLYSAIALMMADPKGQIFGKKNINLLQFYLILTWNCEFEINKNNINTLTKAKNTEQRSIGQILINKPSKNMVQSKWIILS